MQSMTPNTSSSAVLFSFLGSRDPFHSPEDQVSGPLLDLWQALRDSGANIGEVVVAYTPGATNHSQVGDRILWSRGYDAQAAALQSWFAEHAPETNLRLIKLGATNPTDPRQLLPDLVEILDRYRRAERPLHINASSGTPQMLELLKSLRATGWLGETAKLWQVTAPKHRQAGLPYYEEAVTPYLIEALQLESAFGDLRRFDFAGARDEFEALSRFPLQVPGRTQSVAALADVADALLLLDERDYTGAATMLDKLDVHIAPLDALKSLVDEAQTFGSDALVWLTWSRYDRAATQERQADALIWAVILQELMVTQLMDRYGLKVPKNKRISRAALGEQLFAKLKREVPARFQGETLKILDTGDVLEVLAAPSLMGPEAVKAFNTDNNLELAKVRSLRNDIAHQGIQANADKVDWDLLDEVVLDLLQAFPFQAEWAQTWAAEPDRCPASADALHRLTDELKDWLD